MVEQDSGAADRRRITALVLWVVVLLVPQVDAASPRKVRVGVFDNPPIVFTDSAGVHRGLAIDVLQEIAHAEGWRLSFVHAPWDDLLIALAADEIDLLVGIAYTPDRAETFRFSKQTLISNWAVVYRSPGVGISSLMDLKGKRVALMAGSTHTAAFGRLMGRFGFDYTPVSARDYRAVLAAIDEGHADAGVINRVFSVMTAPDYHAVATPIIFNPVEVRYAVHAPANQPLLDALDSHLAREKADPSSAYQHALGRWLGTGEPAHIHPQTYWVAAILLVLFALVFLFNLALRQQVRRRTAELKRQYHFTHAVLNTIGSVVVVMDVDGRIVRFNHAAERLTGYRAEEVVGRYFWEVVLRPEDVDEVRAVFAELTTGTFPNRHENYWIGRDGGAHMVDWSNTVLLDQGGKVEYVIATGIDVTSRREAEAALRTSEARYARSQRAAAVGSWEWNVRTNEVYWSETIEPMFGFPPGGFDGRYETYLSRVHPDDAARVLENIEASLQARADYDVEHRIVLPDGAVRWIAASGEVVCDDAGEPARMVGVVQDITARREMEEALRESQRVLATLMSNLPGMAYRCAVDDEWSMLFVSEGSLNLTGFAPEQFMSKDVRYEQLIEPDDRAKVEAQVTRAIDERRPYETFYRIRTAAGDQRWVWEQGRAVYNPDGRATSLEGFITDVTERFRLREELQRVETQWLEAIEFFADPIYLVDLDDKVVRANRAFYAYVKKSPDQVIGHDMKRLMHPDGEIGPCPVCEARRARRDGVIVMEQDHPDNPVGRPFEVTVRVIRDGAGNASGMLLGMRDLTRQREIEAELRRHRDHLEQEVSARMTQIRQQALIIDQIHDSVIMTDLDGNISSWNQGSERMLGYRRDEVLGRHISLIYPEEARAFLERQVIAELKSRGSLEIEVSLRRRSGDTFFAHLSAAMFYDESGVPIGMVGYALDITERKRAEELLQQQKAELLATNKELESFSYSVSHDLRAPLRSIDGFSHALFEDYYDSLDVTARDYLTRIRAASQRMAKLIDDMLSLARLSRQQMAPAEVDLSALAAQVVAALREAAPDRRIEWQIQPGLTATGDPTLLRVVLDNLLGNAFKFTNRRALAHIEFGMRREGGRQVYFVQDDGAGFDMSYAHKLFAPFQRLHRPDEFEGSGIGLATVARIIHRHGGEVWAEAAAERGATFFFSLGADDRANGSRRPATGDDVVTVEPVFSPKNQ